jgi:hypothetical protein
VYNSAKISLFHRPIVGSCGFSSRRRWTVRSVTCIHTLLRTLTLLDIGARGMGELGHVQEQVGRPSLALPRPILSRQHREQHDPMLAPSPYRS